MDATTHAAQVLAAQQSAEILRRIGIASGQATRREAGAAGARSERRRGGRRTW